MFKFLNGLVQRHLLLIICLVFSLIFLLYYGAGVFELMRSKYSTNQNKSVIKTAIGLPTRLIIPKINVDAPIEYTGVTESGVMEVPDNVENVGWFKLGPQPGEPGNAVIAGHLDGTNGEAGVFININKLRKGDNIYIEDKKGLSLTFIVREIRMYNPGYASDVFNGSDSAHLNLITCDGVWDGAKKSYDKRLVIFTDFLQ